MIKHILRLVSLVILLLTAGMAHAAYESRFDAINFVPAIDGGNYNTVYGSRNLEQWTGTLGFSFDYSNRPLEFRATGGATGRQSVIDHMAVINGYGALGFTDWFEAGINIPFVAYNHFFTDNVAATADHGGGMGDILILAKFRFLDIEKHGVGISLAPSISFPTGDIVRYNGNGHIMGSVVGILDFRLHKKFEVALNLGYTMRDDVTRNFVFAGGATSTLRVDDLFTFGVGGNIKFTKNFQGIIEATGQTVVRNFFSDSSTTSLEAGAGIRYIFGNSGFAADFGGSAGLVEGVGTPRFRVNAGLRWTSPKKECPECAPDPRIQGDRIVLWGKIFFDTNKATIKSISYPVLDDVLDVLNTHPEISLVEVQGHTDFRGSDAFNQRLSQRRAASAMKYLVNKGVSPSRLKAVGYGESKPIASNKTVEGMSQNRRTEFVIISSTGGYTNAPNAAEIHRAPKTTQYKAPNTETKTYTRSTTPVVATNTAPVASTSGDVRLNANKPTTDTGMPNYSGDI